MPNTEGRVPIRFVKARKAEMIGGTEDGGVEPLTAFEGLT
jgi:hypothetical protein